MKLTELGLHDYQAFKRDQLLSTTDKEAVIESREEETTSSLKGGANETLLVGLKDDGSVVFKPRDGESRLLSLSRQQYRRERAAYLVNRFIGFDLVPPTVIRTIDGRLGSAQEFVPDTEPGYHYHKTIIPEAEKMKLDVFDYIIDNRDRHGNNWLIKSGKVFAIDNGQAFGYRGRREKVSLHNVPDELKPKLTNFFANKDRMDEMRQALQELIPRKRVDALFLRLEKLRAELN